MKKKLSLLLLICILSALNINATIYNGSCGTNVNYSLNTETGQLSITGTGAMADYYYTPYYAPVPWSSNRSYIKSVKISDGVTSIGYGAFKDCESLTSVTIPNSVTSIGNEAFRNCSGLTSVTIPNSVTSIGESAFSGCSGLTSVTIPNSVTSIGDYAFYQCRSVSSVTIGNSVTSIGRFTFSQCFKLTSITIPNSVTSIGDWAFDNSGLTSIAIGNGLASIGEGAFDTNPGITSIVVVTGNAKYDSRDNCNAIIETATNTLIAGCKTTLIPNNVTSIGDYAFSWCTGLTSINIPNSVVSIRQRAFRYCTGLTSVTIPNSVTSIGESAFYGCTSLTSIEIPNSVTSIGGGAFTNTAWYNNQPDGLVYAGKIAYEYKGTMPSNTSIIINEGTLCIAGNAFQNCTGLTSVTIPNSVTSIGGGAFSGCSGLTSVTSQIEEPFASNAFGNISSSCALTVPYGTRDAYIAAGWTTDVFKGGIVEMDNPNIISGSCGENVNYSLDTETGLLSITGTGAMTDYSNEEDVPWYSNRLSITAVEISDGVTSIGSVAFYECSGLTSVTIGNSVTSIGRLAFRGCSGLTSIEIPNSVTSIGVNAFYGTAWYNNQPDGLVYAGLVAYKYKGTMPNNISITIKEGTLGIGDDAFYQCSGLTSVTIPNSVTSIGSGAFDGCSGLTSVTIPNSVTSIGSVAFQFCSSLTSVTIGNSVTSIEDSAFDGCTGLTSATIGNSVTSIGRYAFYRCYGLTSIEIPNSVTSIGDYAFTLCSGLTSVISEIKVPFAFGTNAFDDISSSCALTVPYGTRDAYIAAGWTTDVFKGGIVEMAPDAMNINMSANEIGTYCSPYDLDFSGVSGLKAYIMSGFSPSTSTLVLTPVTMVPAGTGLLLRGAEGNYEVPCTTTDMYYTNLLKGVTTATTINPTDGEYTNFILSNGKHGIGFYTLSESGELAANKAYLQLPTASVPSLSRAMRLVFADDITGIDEKKAETKKEDNIFYDLQGRRVDNPTQGLYIVNGKKVFINKY